MKGYYGGPTGTTNALSNGTIHDLLRPSLPKDWGSQPQPKTPVDIISGTGKATVCKFGRYIRRVDPNKIPLKILEKKERFVSRDCPNFFEYPLLSQELVKLRTSNFVLTFMGSIGTKAR